MVTARNIKDGYIDYEASQEFVEADAYDEVMQRGKPKIGDLLLTTEAPLGQAALVDREDIALAQRVIKLDYDPRILLNEFALVWIRSAPFQWQLGSFATGSTALGIKGERLHMLRNLLPPIDEQRAIVADADLEALPGTGNCADYAGWTRWPRRPSAPSLCSRSAVPRSLPPR